MDRHLEYVYAENIPSSSVTMTFFPHSDCLFFFLGSVIVGCVYRNLHELLLGNQSSGEETNTSR